MTKRLFIFRCVPDLGSPITITGRRIVDIGHLLTSIQNMGRHMPFDCTFSDMDIIGHTQSGMIDTIQFKCRMCGRIDQIKTEDPEMMGKRLNLNTAVASILILYF